MTNVLRYAMAGLLLTAGMFAGRSEAGVIINGTRVVYPAQNKEVTVKLTNQGEKPALVQVWLDDGDEKSTPDTAKVPFIVMPPIFRMEPSKGQAVRLLYTKAPLPTDKESLFWLNLLEVPPKSDNPEGRNLLQFAFRTRIKVFFRPAGLAGEPASAANQLTWKLVTGKDGKGVAMQASNPTPYYVSFAAVSMKVGDHSYDTETHGGMVAPGGTSSFEIKQLTSRPSGEVTAEFSVISDYGALNPMSQPVSL
ncbi:MAG: fimbria/pilus periplasmic chaperone [Rhodanobacter sp.]